MASATQTGRPVVVTIARDPALVRTARLVAAAVARRSDLSEVVIEEVRLGVGEACGILINSGLGDTGRDAATPARAGSDGPAGMVEVRLTSGDGFAVEVRGEYDPAHGMVTDLGLDPWALLRGVTDHVSVEHDDGRTTVRMLWPA